MDNFLKKSISYASGFIGLKKDDVILASYPRSGNTWVRFFLCNLVSLKEWNGESVDFEVLNRTMPEFGVNNLMKEWTHETIPRVVKTHKKCWPIFRNKRSILILRDPRDVMVSYYHYKKDRKGEFEDEFSEFVRSPEFGLKSWFEHYDSWRDYADLTIEYEDMRENDLEEFSKVIDFLELPLEKGIVQEAADRASIENVSTAEKDENKNESPDAQFTRNGSTKQWKKYFKQKDLEYYQRLKNHYGLETY